MHFGPLELQSLQTAANWGSLDSEYKNLQTCATQMWRSMHVQQTARRWAAASNPPEWHFHYLNIWKSHVFSYQAESHSWESLDVMRQRPLWGFSTKPVVLFKNNHRLIRRMRWSHRVCSSETWGTIERACEECRKWNWSDIRMKVRWRKEASGGGEPAHSFFFWDTDDNMELSTAGLWHSSHGFKNQKQRK